MLKIKKAFPGTNTFQKVKDLYFASFPADEQLPFGRIALLSILKPSVDLLAYYDGETFCGFSFTVRSGKYLYINFFAVEPSLRSHGYGAKMFQLLRETFPGAALCEVKAPIADTETYDLDVRRMQFWQSNGVDFFGNEYAITNPHGVKYYIGATEAPFDRIAYRGIFDHLSFGPSAQLRILKAYFKK